MDQEFSVPEPVFPFTTVPGSAGILRSESSRVTGTSQERIKKCLVCLKRGSKITKEPFCARD